MLRIISSWPFLVACLLAAIALRVGFLIAETNYIGSPLLDMILTSDGAHARIEAMTPTQREHHRLMTLTLDSLFPLAVGGLLSGLAVRLSGSRKVLVTLPALATMAVDYLENAVQALALAGHDEWLAAKAVLTPVKFGLLAVSAVFVMWLAAKALMRRLSQSVAT